MFEEDYESPSYYQISLRDTDYEWSGALNFVNSASASYDFVLRNRSKFNDKLFFNLKLIKFNRIDKYKIEFKQCSEE